MIIILGRKDRDLLLEASQRVEQCGDYIMRSQVGSHDQNIKEAERCRIISLGLLKALKLLKK